MGLLTHKLQRGREIERVRQARKVKHFNKRVEPPLVEDILFFNHLFLVILLNINIFWGGVKKILAFARQILNLSSFWTQTSHILPSFVMNLILIDSSNCSITLSRVCVLVICLLERLVVELAAWFFVDCRRQKMATPLPSAKDCLDHSR